MRSFYGCRFTSTSNYTLRKWAEPEWYVLRVCFDKNDPEKSECKICDKSFSRKGCTATFLKNHLKSIDPEEFCLFQSANKEKELKKKNYEAGTIVTPLQQAKKQLSLEEVLQKEKKWDTNNPYSKKIDKLIGEMIALQNLPFNFRHGLRSQESIEDVKQKCKKITTHFNHSTIALKQLEKIQDRLNRPYLNVFQDCVMLWNSTFYMFERFLKIKDALSLYPNDNNIESILPEEWKIIECCLGVLKPFEEATHEMSSSQVLISSVIPITQMLLNKLDNYLTKPRESDAIRLAVSNLKSQFSVNFFSLEDNDLYAISTYLDPRYKYKFFKPVTEEKIKDEIIKMVNDPVVTDSPSMSPAEKTKRMRMRDSLDPEPGTSSTCKKICLKSDLAVMLDSLSEDEGEGEPDNSSPDALLHKQLIIYRNKKRLNLDESSLNWWKVNCCEFKILSKLACRYLSPPPASVPSEQLFSGAGLIYNPIRNRIRIHIALASVSNPHPWM
ncbi:Zinc finger BED domain-containing protein 4 [Eumeta japonica]|uniref:Zinc finger BED domain-containing protein 4 n=1 Tax=Eumeta variegata TaxID=151549 RepID=A0A4C1YBN2_EUMVA|nr:Zinc finger BED domain-containing protein 4 [Eumeta japonica]